MTKNTHVKPIMNNRTYLTTKHLVQVVLPALGTLYFTVASIWNLPYADEVVGTLAAIALFLGLALGVSKKQYDNSDAAYDGTAIYSEDRDVPLMEFNEPFENLEGNKSINLKVQKK